MLLLLLLLVSVAHAALTPTPHGPYNTTGGPVKGKLNVHIVSHTHDDVGFDGIDLINKKN